MNDDRALLVTALRALHPSLPELVLAGAWAHRLYALHPLAVGRDDRQTLRTLDADIAIPTTDLPL